MSPESRRAVPRFQAEIDPKLQKKIQRFLVRGDQKRIVKIMIEWVISAMETHGREPIDVMFKEGLYNAVTKFGEEDPVGVSTERESRPTDHPTYSTSKETSIPIGQGEEDTEGDETVPSNRREGGGTSEEEEIIHRYKLDPTSTLFSHLRRFFGELFVKHSIIRVIDLGEFTKTGEIWLNCQHERR